MRVSFLSVSLCPVLAIAYYQGDAPEGRWYGNERPPKHPRSVPANARVACPSEFNFCIDYKWSDAQTCMHPNPHLIKRCMDEGCIQSDFGKARAAELLEDTYCKDFMSREGRFCQWTEQVKCHCPKGEEDIVFANGIIIKPGDSIPSGYKLTESCVYPTPNMKRMPNGAYVDVPIPGGPVPPPIPNDAKLKGNLSWVDPREANGGTRRPVPNFNDKDSSSLYIMTAVVAALATVGLNAM